MSGYTPLFSSIVRSSIWDEDNTTRIVWITMLALTDSQGIVEGSVPGMAHMARVSIAECELAIQTLSNPDLYSRTEDHEGRRIKAIDGGWQIYNLAKYRQKAKSRAEYMRKYREEKKKNQKEKKETLNINTNTNKVTPRNSHVTCVTVTQSPFSPEKQRWSDIAFQVGLTPEEAENSYANFGANNWKRGNGVEIESWEQVPGLLTYWRNNRQNFAPKKPAENEGKTKLWPIAGKTCSKDGCKMPACYKKTGGNYDWYYCVDHMPESVKEKYYA